MRRGDVRRRERATGVRPIAEKIGIRLFFSLFALLLGLAFVFGFFVFF